MGLKYPTICLGIKTFSDQISAELAPNVLREQIISCAVQICSRARQGPEIWMQGGKKRKVANGLRIRKRYSWVIVEFMPVGKTGKFMARIVALFSCNVIEIQTKLCNLLATHLFPFYRWGPSGLISPWCICKQWLKFSAPFSWWFTACERSKRVGGTGRHLWWLMSTLSDRLSSYSASSVCPQRIYCLNI